MGEGEERIGRDLVDPGPQAGLEPLQEGARVLAGNAEDQVDVHHPEAGLARRGDGRQRRPGRVVPGEPAQQVRLERLDAQADAVDARVAQPGKGGGIGLRRMHLDRHFGAGGEQRSEGRDGVGHDPGRQGRSAAAEIETVQRRATGLGEIGADFREQRAAIGTRRVGVVACLGIGTVRADRPAERDVDIGVAAGSHGGPARAGPLEAGRPGAVAHQNPVDQPPQRARRGGVAQNLEVRNDPHHAPCHMDRLCAPGAGRIDGGQAACGAGLSYRPAGRPLSRP